MRPPVPAEPVPIASPADPAPASDTKRRIDEEHRRLGELLAALEAARDLDLVKVQLAELGAMLRRHFETEEGEGGLHDVVGEQAAHRLATLQRLMAEHAEILVQVEQLRISVGDCLDGPVRRVLLGVTGLAERLRRHEADEEELFADAFWNDIGGRSD